MITLTIGDRIRQAREGVGWTQRQLAERLSISQSAVAGWELNRHEPDSSTIAKISELTGRPVAWFYGANDEAARQMFYMELRRDPDKALGIKRLPILGRIRAGGPNIAEHEPDLGTLPLPVEIAKYEDFALLIEGDSMEKVGMYDGDIAVVKSSSQAQPGQVVIARINHGADATMKILVNEAGRLMLRAASWTDKYPDIELTTDDRIQGVVLGNFSTPGKWLEKQADLDDPVRLIAKQTGIDVETLRGVIEALKPKERT